ncbi:Synembryn-A [Zancudomyces culisetae]|uniref:Synembryn-A n=1 Tax=Zancudomyces culisetae TaxID=1213189 RepID=A0A1R1PVZ1_ZANCU|nr:Synembryn-A [Zancudomyces culisetae]|eukprot:OMH85072.1 Synembryn-A [Zancudomyces culisetae]
MEVLSGKYIRHIEDSALLIQVVQVLFLFPVQSPSNVKDTWFPKGNVMKNVDVVFALLEQRVREYTSQNTAASGLFGKGIADEERAKDIPLICILGRCVAANDDVRQDVYHRLFSDRDYHELPEKGDSVRATITKIIGSPVQNDYSQLLGDLVLVVCNSDINSFVKNIGFGNASGYLNSRKLSFDHNSVSSSTLFVKAASTSEQIISNVNDFDVVTGAIQDNADIEKELAAMTEEEKEREAEKLFVLFEKLNKTGIIRTQFDFRNP